MTLSNRESDEEITPPESAQRSGEDLVEERRRRDRRDQTRQLGEESEPQSRRSGGARKRDGARKRKRLSLENSGEVQEEIAETSQVREGRRVGGQVYLPPLLFQTETMPLSGRMNAFSKPKYILEIVKVLEGTREYDWLRKSCFGKLFDLACRKCALSGKLVHQFLCRQLVTKKRHEMWFVFGGYPIRFSLREFDHLTGLNCQPYPAEEEIKAVRPAGVRRGTYWRELLGPKQYYSIIEIVNMLKADKRLPSDQRMAGARRLRLALVVLVEGVLLSSSPVVKASRKVVEMVRDLEKFVEFPWGRCAFEKTIEMLMPGPKNPTTACLIEKLKKSHATAHGFTIALQLLFLEAVPMLETLLPDVGEDMTLGSGILDDLPKFKSFHTTNIVEVEHDRDLHVESLLGAETDLDDGLLGWEDEVQDEDIEHICAALESGQSCRQEDWADVGNQEPELPSERMRRANRIKITENKGKKRRHISTGFAGSHMCGIDELDVAPEETTWAEGIFKTAIMAEVRQLMKSQTAMMEKLVKEEMQRLKNEIKRDIMKGIRNQAKKSRQDGEANWADNPNLGTESGMGTDSIIQNILRDVNRVGESCEILPVTVMKGITSNAGKKSNGVAIEEMASDSQLSVGNSQKAGMGIEGGLEASKEDLAVEEMTAAGRVDARGLESEKERSPDVESKGEETAAEHNEVGENLIQVGKGESGSDEELDANEQKEQYRMDEARDISGCGSAACLDSQNQISEDVKRADHGPTDDKWVESEEEEEDVSTPTGGVIKSPEGRSESAEEVEVTDCSSDETDPTLQQMIEKKRIRKKPKRYGYQTTTDEKENMGSKTYTSMGDIDDRVKTKFKTKLAANGTKGFIVNGHRVKSSFFKELYTPKNHINSDHMEALLSLVWRKLGDALQSERVAILDTWFTSMLATDHERYRKAKCKESFKWSSIIRNYIRGSVPSRGEKLAWVRDVDLIYTPMHWGRAHWVAILINLKNGKVLILDPLIAHKSDSKLPAIMKPVVVMLPIIVREMVNEDEVMYELPKTFSYERCPNISQNDRTGDCGPLTAKFIELHAQGMELTGVDDAMVDQIRMKFAIDVFEEFVVSL